ncbi:GlxA family transcriptional regulator [Insolitispirillum peregrinum]|uniref:GlxA family transcriptional regulator n=1 Tax=Insolitispirillum peregrinum TaxID=80876 RepID=UPI00360C97CF
MITERTIVFVLYAQAVILDLAGPMQAFTIANEELARRGQPAHYRLLTAGMQDGAVTTSAGLRVLVDHAFDDPALADGCDTVLVVGGPGIDQAVLTVGFLDWLRQQERRVPRLGSVCSGAFALAEAGVLDGRPATTHWSRASELASRYPAIRVQSDRLHTYGHGAEDDAHVFTSAGITAGIDLALALIEDDLGPSMALAVARRLVMFLRRPGGQAQCSAFLAPDLERAPRLAGLLEWLPSVLGQSLTLEQMAEQAGMTPRTFSRVFAQQVGESPGRYLERLRVEAARQMVQSGTSSLAMVARCCGFGHPETLRRAFHRHLGVSPQDYAARFGLSRAG